MKRRCTRCAALEAELARLRDENADLRAFAEQVAWDSSDWWLVREATAFVDRCGQPDPDRLDS